MCCGNSPSDMESYIRPGCVILTIYFQLGKSAWDELCCDLGSSLTRLLDASNDHFWRIGWVYARPQQRAAFVYNGQVVLDTLLPFKSHNDCRILSITPIAVSGSERVQFSVKGLNLSRSTSRLLCSLQGEYLGQESCNHYDLAFLALYQILMEEDLLRILLQNDNRMKTEVRQGTLGIDYD